MKTYRKIKSTLQKSTAMLLVLLLASPQNVGALPVPGTMTQVTESTGYDGNGNVTSRIDGNGTPTTFEYDAMNRLLSVDYPDGEGPDVSFAYDENGNLTTLSDATGITSYAYDFFDRLISIDYPDGNFVQYGYDNVGNRTDLQYGNWLDFNNNGNHTYIHYEFDENNRIHSVQNVQTTDTTTYTYDAAGNISRRTLPNGAYTDYKYDTDGRLIAVDHRRQGGSLICKYEYILNAIGNRTRVVETTPEGEKTTVYTYDVLNRLDIATYPEGRIVDYDYDSFGNRIRMTEEFSGTTKVREYAYDVDSRLLSTTMDDTDEEHFYYDTTGNLVQRVRSTDGRQIEYVYDYENRLTHYFDGTDKVEYVYNGLGQRVARLVNGVQTNFINDPNRAYEQVLAEIDTNGAARRVYEWGNELINQEDINGQNRHYYLHDSINGSVRRLIDTSQAVVNRYEYDAFGEVTSELEGIANEFGFHGEVQEEETGLLFLRARYVDPETGRFLTRDPIPGKTHEPITLNAYCFVKNDPVNFIDPSGLYTVKEFSQWVSKSSPDVSVVLKKSFFSGRLGFRYDTQKGTQVDVRVGGEFGLKIKGAEYKIGYQTDPVSKLTSLTGSMFVPWMAGNVSLAVTPGSDMFRIAYTSAFLPSVPVDGGEAKGQVGVTMPYGVLRLGSSIIDVGSSLGGRFINGRPGGVALNKSAEVLLDINEITGGTYDPDTGQIILYGKEDNSATALPPMNLDDLAVAFRAINQGTMPVVSIEPPVVTSPPQWPDRECFTVRYGPFVSDPDTGEWEVLDVSSKTHFGWVMYDADRQMKCLGLGEDNRDGTPVNSNVTDYKNLIDLGFMYLPEGQTLTRFWFHPGEMIVAPTADGRSMEIKKVEMQLSTETMFSSEGQVESTPDAEYFANHFTDHYDEFADEQVTYDDDGNPHYIFKELKQLAALVGIVKWVQEYNIPMDLSFLENYTPQHYDSAPDYTPSTTVTEIRNTADGIRVYTVWGGVDYCSDLDSISEGDPSLLADAALNSRAGDTQLAWTFNQTGEDYNAAALSVDRKEKSGGFSHSDLDALLQVNGAIPLTLTRHYDSFNVNRTIFGRGWTAQPYSLDFKGDREQFNLCSQQWEGFGEIWFNDRGSQAAYKFVPSGLYDKAADSLGIASRFDPNEEILVYRYETKDVPGLLFSDNRTKMTMRLADGVLLDFDLNGRLTKTEDRNGNGIDYTYDSNKRLLSIGQPGGRTISFTYDVLNRVASASLPEGHSVSYAYNADGNLQSAQVDPPTGKLIQYSYDADHSLVEIQDENGNATTSRSYDLYGRVISTSQPGVTTDFTQNHSLTDKTSQTTGPESFSQSMEFNDNHDVTKVTDSRGNSFKMKYNENRDVISETLPDGWPRESFYDERGNRIATVLPNGRADVAYFDQNNNPTFTIHSSANPNFFDSFDAEHVLISDGMERETINLTQYDYDAKGNPTTITNANNNQMTFGYDPTGNPIWMKDGLGNQTTYSYDGYSRLTRIQNHLGHAVDLTYDERDNITRVAIAAGTVDFVYNNKNELTSVTRGDSGARQTTRYTYNARGQIKTVIDPAGVVTEYQYDERGNLTQIKHDNVERLNYEYDGLNRLTNTHYNGTAGGGKAAIVVTGPVGGEELKDKVAIIWKAIGNWTSGSDSITIQYSTNGLDWFDIATVNAGDQSYTWDTRALNSASLQIRFVRPGDNEFQRVNTAAFTVLNGPKYYVNDVSTLGDEYCNVAGRPYNGTTVTGTSPDDPVDNIQDIIDNYVLKPGDTLYVDTGNYMIANDIWIEEDDSGSLDKPLIITGPIGGGSAIITHTNPGGVYAHPCIIIADSDPDTGPDMEGVVIEHLKFTGGTAGIMLNNAKHCTVRHNECYENGVDGVSGEARSGMGIWLYRGGNHTIANNSLHDNGAQGGAGTSAGMDGGSGRGFGMYLDSSNNNTIRENQCFNNGGIGGTAGSGLDQPGYSEGIGIFEYSSDSNHIIGNTLYNNDARGVSSIVGPASKGLGRGILLLDTTNSVVEQNRIYSNNGWGGDSNLNNGGYGGSAGIYGLRGQNLTIQGNILFDHNGFGGYSGLTASDTIGSGEGGGIFLNESSDSTIKNNLAYDNFGFAPKVIGDNQNGWARGYGIRLQTSVRCEIFNNTLYRNWAKIEDFASDFVTCGQIYVGYTSADNTVKNNICEAYHDNAYAIYVSSSSQAGFVSDYNNLYSLESARHGLWGTTSYLSMAGWQAASGQDSHSVSVDSGFYDAGLNIFHLTSDSPLIDAGENLADVEIDIDVEARPEDGPDGDLIQTHDIGCDEFVDSDRDTLADKIEEQVTHTSPGEMDSDSDGLPDGWETSNGLDPMDPFEENGPHGDPDKDGYSNREELFNNSLPNNGADIPSCPPEITSFTPVEPSLFILEEEQVSFGAAANDANGDPVSYSWNLDGVEQSTTDSWTFTTDEESSGTDSLIKEYVLELAVTAGSDRVIRQWTLIVKNRNHAPVLQPLSDIVTQAGSTVHLNPVFFDPDNQNSVPGDDNTLTVHYSGWMTGPDKIVATEDYGINSVTVAVCDNGNPILCDQQKVQITVEAANLRPHQPTDWDNTIVLSTVEGTHSDTPVLRFNQPYYIDYAEANQGSDVSGPASMQLLIDGIIVDTVSRSTDLAPQAQFTREDLSHTFTTPGLHTITLIVDVYNEVEEGVENDNTYTKYITIEPIVKQFEETSYYLKDVSFINGDLGWAVGEPHWDQTEKTYKGTIVKTEDGGETWAAQEAGTSQTLRGVCFVDADNGWAVGANGTILHTDDGGSLWEKQTVDTGEEFRAVIFTDTNNGWATSIEIVQYNDRNEPEDWRGSIWHTSDGGETWTEQSIPENAGILNRIDFVDPDNGWAVGVKVTGYDSFGPQHVGAVYHTSDGGLTWEEQYSPNLDIVFTGVDFVDSNNGWVVGFKGNSGIEGGTVFHTSDGGLTWERQDPESILWDVHFLDSNRGYAVGVDYIAAWGAPVYRTLDGGSSWEKVIMEKRKNEGLFGVAVNDDQVVAVGDYDFIVKSSAPWKSCDWVFPEPSCYYCGCLFEQFYINIHYRFEDVFFVDENHGWAVGMRNFEQQLWGQIIFHTKNGGMTWETQYEHAPADTLFNYDFRLDSLFFTDSLNGWTVGGSDGHYGAILHTTDGGINWQEQGGELYESWDLEFFAVQFLDGMNGWALAADRFPYDNIFLAHTTDGGINWQWIDTEIEGNISIGYALVQGEVVFTNPQYGWAVGGRYEVIHTNDGGASWMQQELPEIVRCYSVEFINNQEGWIAGQGLFHTTDGGSTWLKKEIEASGDFQDIQFVNSLNGWLVGDSGVIMNTEDGGDTWNPKDSGTYSSLRGLSFIDPHTGWAVGDRGTILAISALPTHEGDFDQDNDVDGLDLKNFAAQLSAGINSITLELFADDFGK